MFNMVVRCKIHEKDSMFNKRKKMVTWNVAKPLLNDIRFSFETQQKKK